MSPSHRFAIVSCLGFFPLVLFSCGGPRMIFSDLYPEPGSTVQDSIVTVKFKVAEPLDLKSFNSNSLLIEGSRTGPLTVGIQYNATDSVVRMTVQDHLIRDEFVRIVLTDKLRLASGSRVPSAASWGFWVGLLPSQIPGYRREDTATALINVEDLPEPIGGIAAIQANVVYPEKAKRAGIEGTVYLEAFLDETGQVTKIVVLRGIGGIRPGALKA